MNTDPSSSKDGKGPDLIGFAKGLNLFVMSAQGQFDLGGGAVAEMNPDDLRRVPQQGATVTKIHVFGDDHKTIVTGSRSRSVKVKLLWMSELWIIKMQEKVLSRDIYG